MSPPPPRSPLVHDDKPVERRNRRQPVGGQNRLACISRGVSLSWIAASTFRIERRSRFVENENRCVLQHDARNGDTLALATGELDAALADMGIEAQAAALVLQPLDEIMRLRLVGRRDQIGFRGVQRPIMMLSRIERCKSAVSCVTMPIFERSDSCVTAAISWPAMRMRPPSRS